MQKCKIAENVRVSRDLAAACTAASLTNQSGAAHQPVPSVVSHHVELRDGLVVLAQVDEHVVVRGEEREALGLVRQIVDDREGDGRAVVGRRAAASHRCRINIAGREHTERYERGMLRAGRLRPCSCAAIQIRERCLLTELVEDDERSTGRLVENERRLLHFDCERGPPLHDAVGRADSRHDAVDRREAGRLDRHVAADLREDRQTARAAQKRRLAACREEQRKKSASRSR